MPRSRIGKRDTCFRWGANTKPATRAVQCAERRRSVWVGAAISTASKMSRCPCRTAERVRRAYAGPPRPDPAIPHSRAFSAWISHLSNPPLQCLTCDTLGGMAEVTIRDLRNRGGDVVERAEQGEQITITRAGKPVAELRALPQSALSAETLLDRRRRLPRLDPAALRRDIDQTLDPRL